MNNKFLTFKEFKTLFQISENNDLVEGFFKWQIDNWEFARKNYETLKELQIKEFEFSDTNIIVQYNPHRVGSTLALTDEKAIANRKCFLCNENLHSEQNGLRLTDNYTLLVNPFPIIPVHFTAKFNVHLPQKISENFYEILKGAKILGEKYFLLYNGPEAGASVPEHRHFQGGGKAFFPLINEVGEILLSGLHRKIHPKIELISRNNEAELYGITDELRRYFVITGNNAKEVEVIFFKLFAKMEELFPSEKETKLNLVSTIEKGKHLLFIFPRKAHRPKCFYAEDETKLLVSPATLDFGGIVVLPREEDFNKINSDKIREIFSEVSFSREDFLKLISSLQL